MIPLVFDAPIVTERLALRLMTVGDVDDVHAYQSLEEVCRYQLFEPRSRDPRNLASVALCRRLGMRLEAQFVKDMFFKGDWADTWIFAILAEEWRGSSIGQGV